jgi:hypothetical protein
MEGPAGTWVEHIDDELLEQYALDRLQDEPLARVEEHLLLCGFCRDRLEELDAFVASLRSAVEHPEIHAAEQAQGRHSPPGGLKPFWAFTAAAAAVLGVAYLTPLRTDRPTIQPVELHAFRGETSGGSAAADLPLALRLDVTGLPQAANYRVEIVDFAGTPKWGATVTYDARIVTVRAPGIPAGAYWVRVLEPAGKEILREYALTVR